MSTTYKTPEIYAADTAPIYIAPKNSPFVNPSTYLHYCSKYTMQDGQPGFTQTMRFANGTIKTIMGFSLLHATFPQPTSMGVTADSAIVIRISLLPYHHSGRVINTLPHNITTLQDTVSDSTFVIMNTGVDSGDRVFHRYGEVPQSHVFPAPVDASGIEFHFYNSQGDALLYDQEPNQQPANFPDINILLEVWGSPNT